MKFVYFKKNISKYLAQKNKSRKNFFRCIFVLIAGFFAVCFLSCSNIYNETDIKNKNSENFRLLQMNITSDEGYIFFSPKDKSAEKKSSSRTIMPSYESSNFVYYLYYKKVNDKNSATIIKNIIFEPLSQTTGTISHNFAKDYYEFDLFALTTKMSEKMINSSSEINLLQLRNYASFHAATFIDLRNEAATVFHLKPNTYSNGAGSFKINISHQNDWEIDGNYKVTAGIYSIDDDTLIYPSSPFVIRNTQYSGSSVKNHIISSFESDVTEQIQTVPNGTYNLSVRYTLYDSSNNNPLKTFEYSEKIEILMNQTTESDFIIPDFIDKKPEAPSMLTAAYKIPSEKQEYYPVQFKWEDNSKTENYFNLELLKVDDDSQIPSLDDEKWDSLCITYGGSTSYDYLSQKKSIFYVDGSLSKNAASFTINLPLGSRYIARICAVNHIGSSSWAYINFPTSQEISDANFVFDTDFTAFVSETPADVTTINLYRISYETQNGTITAVKDENPVSAPLYTLYNHQHNINQDNLLVFYPDGQIDGQTHEYYAKVNGITTSVHADSLSLTNDNNPWAYWTIDTFENSTHITRDSNYQYTGYKNITIFAHYENEDDTSKYENYYLKPEDIYVHFYKEGLVTQELTDSITLSGINLNLANLDDETGVSQYYIEVSKRKVSTIEFNLDYSKIDNCHFDNVQIDVKRNSDSTLMFSQTLTSETIKSGTLKFGITGEEWNSTEYSIQITVHSADFENATFCYYLYLNVLD